MGPISQRGDSVSTETLQRSLRLLARGFYLLKSLSILRFLSCPATAAGEWLDSGCHLAWAGDDSDSFANHLRAGFVELSDLNTVPRLTDASAQDCIVFFP